MPVKRVLRAERLRRVPTQFSWIDQRLVREGHVERCGVDALGLYLKQMGAIPLLNREKELSLAIRLEKAGWSTADAWLRMQMERDLWQTRQRADKIKVKKFATEPSGT